MFITTVLAHCPTCNEEVDAKIIGCDECYENFLEQGGKEGEWDDLFCEHLECTVCQEDLSP